MTEDNRLQVQDIVPYLPQRRVCVHVISVPATSCPIRIRAIQEREGVENSVDASSVLLDSTCPSVP